MCPASNSNPRRNRCSPMRVLYGAPHLKASQTKEAQTKNPCLPTKRPKPRHIAVQGLLILALHLAEKQRAVYEPTKQKTSAQKISPRWLAWGWPLGLAIPGSTREGVLPRTVEKATSGLPATCAQRTGRPFLVRFRWRGVGGVVGDDFTAAKTQKQLNEKWEAELRPACRCV